MHKNLPIIAFCILLIGIGIFFVTQKALPASMANNQILETQSGEVTMHMGKDSYSPINIKIKKGTKVTFANGSEDYRWPASDLHPSHLIFPEFDSKKALVPREEWSFVFEKSGEWTYHDHLAPYITGTIIVVE